MIVVSTRNLFELDDKPIASDWDDALAMLRDIKAYVTETGDKVLAADDPGYNHKPPRVPRIGYCSEKGKTWTIMIGRVRRLDDAPVDDQVKRIVHTCLKSAAGRQRLVDWLNGGMVQLELPFKDSESP